MLAASVLFPAGAYAAGDGQKPLIVVPKTIVLSPGTETPMDITVWPPEAVPPGGSLTISGLPPKATVFRGKFVSPGTWEIGMDATAPAALVVPMGMDPVTRVTIRLADAKGMVITEAQAALVVETPAGKAEPAENALPKGAARIAALPAPPAGRDSQIEIAPAALPLPAAPPQIGREDKDKAIALVEKGDKSLASGNVTVARLCYQSAAELGWAPAAVALGGTYDPNELGRLTVIGGSQADAEKAKVWYNKARQLGASEADVRLLRLGGG
jgi:hypothetical protein